MTSGESGAPHRAPGRRGGGDHGGGCDIGRDRGGLKVRPVIGCVADRKDSGLREVVQRVETRHGCGERQGTVVGGRDRPGGLSQFDLSPGAAGRPAAAQQGKIAGSCGAGGQIEGDLVGPQVGRGGGGKGRPQRHSHRAPHPHHHGQRQHGRHPGETSVQLLSVHQLSFSPLPVSYP